MQTKKTLVEAHMEYIKIHSLWKREGWYFDQGKKTSPDYQKGRQSFIIGDYAEPEFGNIKKWHVEEKIDGTNIRIMYQKGKVQIGGRTDNAQLPMRLLTYLRETFTEYTLNKTFRCKEGEDYPNVILFGEGYGAGIQKGGGNYCSTNGFVLFDAFVDGWWLQRENVKEIANKLEIPMAPELGIMTEEEIVDFVKSKPISSFATIPVIMEGVVCRSEPLMLFRKKPMISSEPLIYADYYAPIMWKLKCKEF